MKALVTGASSGIGKEIALYLDSLGYDLYVVARDKNKLDKIYQNCHGKVTTIGLNLAVLENCYELYDKVKNESIDIIVNNAGFGDAGNFIETNLDKELEMIRVNVQAYHVLMKLFLKDFTKRDRGRILNVASIAGFMPGPYMATYYATKAYIIKLSLAVAEELKQMDSKVKISVFCPGPVKTNFTKVAKVHFNIGSLTAEKANYFLAKVSPMKVILKVNSLVQERASK